MDANDVRSNGMLGKVIGVPLRKELTKNADGTVLVLGIFTSDSPDELGDIITRGATERAIPKYRQWGNIRYMHQPRPVGVVTRIGEADNLAWNEVEIKVIDPQAVFEVEQGLLKALSIGALIKWEDVELLRDGGLLINDYQLAEISLVDHPANYDAALKALKADDALRHVVVQHGFDAVAVSMKSMLDRELSMEDTENIDVQEDAEEIVAAEDAVVDAEPVVVEQSIDGEQPEIIEADAPVEVEAVEEVEAVADVSEMAELKALVLELTAAVKALADSFGATQRSLETTVEASPAGEQADSDGDVVERSLDADGNEQGDTGLAIERSAAVQETQLPEAEEQGAVVAKTSRLYRSLEHYLEQRRK